MQNAPISGTSHLYILNKQGIVIEDTLLRPSAEDETSIPF